MIIPFTFAKLPEIHFGIDTVSKLPDKIIQYGKNILLVLGKQSFQKSSHWDVLQGLLKNKNIRYSIIHVENEPTAQFIDETCKLYRNDGIELVVAIGGGSVVDAGKALSAMLLKNETIVSFLEGVGDKIHDGEKLPFIAVPTTSGTGSETTKNAVISGCGEQAYKKSLRHDNFIPNVSIIDPMLAKDCPPSITAASGLDAFSQLLESYTSTKASRLTDSLALPAMIGVEKSLLKVYNDGNNLEARTDMAYASAMSGISLANAGLGLIHGFASAIGGYFNIPHGVICGTFVGVVNRKNIDKLIEQKSNNTYLFKYAEVGKLFTSTIGKSNAYYALLLADVLDNLVETLKLPKLSAFGITENDIEKIVHSSGHKNNPVSYSEEELKLLLIERI